MRHHSKRWASAAAVVAAALAAACTAQPPPHKNAQPYPTEPWALQLVKPATVDPELQAELDKFPPTSTSRILGVAKIAGSRLVIAVQGNTCQALTLSSATGSNDFSPSVIGVSRPASTDSTIQGHADFPGNLLAGPYAKSGGIATPYFQYVTIGCSENEIAVQVEGADPTAKISLSGDAARSWVEGKYLYVAVTH
ncbi:hypothetical protein Kpho01_75190 [Kitasatospora phosalacinea]|uniref:Uncharacterized protein n=1 Tax=Kitasatospora phosalacinea TaxID=2065 RepID=A0A9W6PR79_9ACTN|nr:hypothetical protein Kpho01_75190 [Kitasatospora phosalacinea]